MITCAFENGNKASLRHAVVDALIIKDNKLLMVKRASKLLEGEKWALVGGFVERDEDLRTAEEREIMEETGYTVTNLQLFRIIDNPNRRHEDRQNISFVFLCEAGAKTGKHDWEVTEQKWFAFDELPNDEEIAFDHKSDIDLYLKYKKENFDLPLLL